jgi:hypothetical protein
VTFRPVVILLNNILNNAALAEAILVVTNTYISAQKLLFFATIYFYIKPLSLKRLSV